MQGARKRLRLYAKAKYQRKETQSKACSMIQYKHLGWYNYNEDISIPSGIANPALNCYSNAILQCLFNLPQFQNIV